MSARLEEFRSYWTNRPLSLRYDDVHSRMKAAFSEWAEGERMRLPMARRLEEDGPWRIAREAMEAQLRDHPDASLHSEGLFWLEMAESGGCLDDGLFDRVVEVSYGNVYGLLMSREERAALQQIRAADPSGSAGGWERDELEVKETLDARFRQRLAVAMEVMDERGSRLLQAIRYTGIEWLVPGCKLAEALSFQRTPHEDRLMEARRGAIAKLAAAHLWEDDLEKLPDALRGFDPKTLLMVAEYAEEGHQAIHRLVTEKPGFREVLALRGLLGQGLPGESRPLYSHREADSGEFDAHELRGLMDAVPADLLKWFCESFVTANEAMVLLATKGANRPRLDAALKRHGQMALKVYSLLPLPADEPEREAEVKRRYVQIDEFVKGSKRFGSERQANNRRCAEIALQNLARNAGYQDADELFFDIESKAAAAVPPAHEEDGCRAGLEFDSAGPALVFEKSGKALKAVPAAMKKSPGFKDLKAAHDLLKEQGRRFRRALEVRMATGASIERRHYDALWGAPLLRGLISSLVFMRADGECGLPGEDGESLTGVDGRRIPLGDEPLKLAHAIHLERGGELAAWRNHCFATGAVQAIKQVFREFYVITPAEEITSPQSHRFANHRVASTPFGGMMKNRGWTTGGSSYDCPEPKRYFRSQGLVAELLLEECGRFLAETESVVTGPVSFKGLDGRAVGLGEVPATIFSEVMRDLDLFVSVGHTVGDAGAPSAELMVQRFELFRGLVGKLKLRGVSLDGHFARIEGKLATYRVHLASGAVFMGEGRHLCIVPATSWKKPADLYLPFLDEDDRKVAEIFSKILMLSKDTAIKDALILSQISAAKAGIRE